MGINIDKISDYNKNRYKLSNACIKYSELVPVVNEDEYLKNNEKVVIPAIDDVLDEKIQFTYDKPNNLDDNF